MDLRVIDLSKRGTKGMIGIKQKTDITGSNLWQYMDDYPLDIEITLNTH